MIKLILAEDERVTREGLIKHIPWSECGIERVEGAKNGVEALEMAEWLEPDIVLTDVSMPKMDGIQLASLIREKYPDCKIIFLSGYSDKEYLKSAIKLNALNYIEKPIDENELIATLSNAVLQYRAEYDKKAKDEMMKDKFKKNRDLVRQKLAVDLIKSNVNLAELEGMFEDAEVECGQSYYTTVAVKFNWNRTLTHNEKESLRSTLSSNICSFLSELSGWFLSGFLDSELYLIHFKEKIKAVQNWESKLNVLLEKILAEFNGNYAITIGVGLPVYGLGELKNSFNMALKASNMQFYEGLNTIIFYSGLNAQDGRNPIMEEGFLSAFSEYLHSDKRDEVILLLNEYYSRLAASKASDSGVIRNMYLKLLFDLYSIAQKRSIRLVEAEDIYEHMWKSVSDMDTFEKIHLYLVSQVRAFFKLIEEKDAYGRNVYDIIKFIHNNYHNQKLSVKAIAEHKNFSESYMCTFFKKTTGKTINDYITEVRIEKSKELLEDRSIKIYEIAKKVGYDNENYFSKVFRKNVNASPSEFRERFFL